MASKRGEDPLDLKVPGSKKEDLQKWCQRWAAEEWDAVPMSKAKDRYTWVQIVEKTQARIRKERGIKEEDEEEETSGGTRKRKSRSSIGYADGASTPPSPRPTRRVTAAAATGSGGRRKSAPAKSSVTKGKAGGKKRAASSRADEKDEEDEGEGDDVSEAGSVSSTEPAKKRRKSAPSASKGKKGAKSTSVEVEDEDARMESEVEEVETTKPAFASLSARPSVSPTFIDASLLEPGPILTAPKETIPVDEDVRMSPRDEYPTPATAAQQPTVPNPFQQGSPASAAATAAPITVTSPARVSFGSPLTHMAPSPVPPPSTSPSTSPSVSPQLPLYTSHSTNIAAPVMHTYPAAVPAPAEEDVSHMYAAPSSIRRATMPPSTSFSSPVYAAPEQELRQRRHSEKYMGMAEEKYQPMSMTKEMEESAFERMRRESELQYQREQQAMEEKRRMEAEQKQHAQAERAEVEPEVEAEGDHEQLPRMKRRLSDHVRGIETEAPAKPPSFCQRVRLFLRSLFYFLLRTLTIGLMLVTLAVVVYQALRVRELFSESPTVFCPSGEGMQPQPTLPLPPGQEMCKPCPPNGLCTQEGRLICNPGYMREGDLCVVASEVKRRGRDMLEQSIAVLQSRLGEVWCGEADDGHRWMTAQELKAHARSEFGDHQFSDTEWEQWERAWEYALERLMEESEGAGSNIQKQGGSEHRLVIDFPKTGKGSMRFSATHPTLTLPCNIRLLAWEHKLPITMVSLVLSLMTYVWYIFRRWRWRRALSFVVADRIRDRLLMNLDVDPLTGRRIPLPMAVDHLREELIKMMRGDKEVWRRAVDIVNKDTRVQKGRERFGMVDRDSWQWTGPLA